MKRGDDPRDRIPPRPWPAVPIWFAVLAPPIAALSQLQAGYIFEHVACSTGSKLGIHLVSVILLLVVLCGGLVARREWKREGSQDPQQLPGPVGTRRLMSLFGMVGAFIFGLFILAQWFPSFVLAPCVRT